MFFGGLPSPVLIRGPPSPAYIDRISNLASMANIPSPFSTRKTANEDKMASYEPVVKVEAMKVRKRNHHCVPSILTY